MKYKWLFILFSAVLIVGCEKTVDFSLKDNPASLVVEATIENGKAPVVYLSHSLNFFSTINPDLLEQSFVHDALVTISDGAEEHLLKEYTVPLGFGYYGYYYSVDSSSALTGQLNHTYSLHIKASNKDYTAVTTIPNLTKQIDSVWWKQAPFNEDSTKAVVLLRATDPKGFGDYVRYFTKRNTEPFYAGINSVYDDLLIDGTTYDLQVEPGVDRNAKRSDNENFFYKGDTVTLKLCNIDKATYDFWRTMEYSYQSIGNPFATPVKVLGNISNGALGYFGGYAAQYRTIVIPQ